MLMMLTEGRVHVSVAFVCRDIHDVDRKFP